MVSVASSGSRSRPRRAARRAITRQGVPAVGGAAAHVVDRARPRPPRLAERAAPAASGSSAAGVPQPRRVEPPAEEVLGVAARAAESARPSRCRCRPRRRSGCSAQREGGTPRSPSRCGCRPCRTAAGRSATGTSTAADQLVRLQRVALHAGVEVGDRDPARCRVRDSTSTTASAASSGGCASPAGEAAPRLPPTVPRLRICGDPTVRAAIASPGSRSPSSAIDPGVGHPGAEPDRAVGLLPLASSSVDPGEVEQRPRPVPVEVELDHHVGAARDRHRLRVRRLGLQGLTPCGRLQKLHVALPGNAQP